MHRDKQYHRQTDRSREPDGNGESADNYAPCPDCLGYFMRTTMYRHKLDCPAVTKSSHKEKKTSKQNITHQS